VAEVVFPGFVRMLRGRDSVRGCLIVSEALACCKDAEPVRRKLARLRQATVAAPRKRFERAARDEDLLAGTDCATPARYVAAVLNGVAVQAANGATAAELRRVVAMATRAWTA
jgi:hypothetical protein